MSRYYLDASALVKRYVDEGAIHLATALRAQQFLADRNYPALTFLSADDRLNQAAAAEGLAVDNPNAHA